MKNRLEFKTLVGFRHASDRSLNWLVVSMHRMTVDSSVPVVERFTS